MLFVAENFEDLQTYIDGMKDKTLTEWWARYAESKGAFEKALACYKAAGDYLSIVRVYCFQNRVEEVAANKRPICVKTHLF
jgi:intraflagellar transport protein 140